MILRQYLHADHLSAGRGLAAAAGAEYILHASAEARFPFRAVEDGDVLCPGAPGGESRPAPASRSLSR